MSTDRASTGDRFARPAKAALAAAALGLAAAAPAQEPREPLAEHLHWRPAAGDEKPRPWAVLLPGGGGIDVFGDGGAYYFQVADWLNAHGFDALVVHYQQALPPVAEIGPARLGAEIARVAAEGVADARRGGRMDPRCDGIVIAWSMGGNGMWELARRGSEALPGLAAAIAYYPATAAQEPGYRAAVPVTVLQGDADTMTPLATLAAFVAAAKEPGSIDVHIFEGARHGFDITTLAAPQLDGRFERNEEAELAARTVLDEVLARADLGCALD